MFVYTAKIILPRFPTDFISVLFAFVIKPSLRPFSYPHSYIRINFYKING